jgi:hypothetical protein
VVRSTTRSKVKWDEKVNKNIKVQAYVKGKHAHFKIFSFRLENNVLIDQ